MSLIDSLPDCLLKIFLTFNDISENMAVINVCLTEKHNRDLYELNGLAKNGITLQETQMYFKECNICKNKFDYDKNPASHCCKSKFICSSHYMLGCRLVHILDNTNHNMMCPDCNNQLQQSGPADFTPKWEIKYNQIKLSSNINNNKEDNKEDNQNNSLFLKISSSEFQNEEMDEEENVFQRFFNDDEDLYQYISTVFN